MRTILLVGIFAAGAFAQAPTDIPPIIQLVRKPGIVAASTRPYANARAAINVVGMTAITGLPETWQLEAHFSFASIEDLDKGLTAVTPLRADPSQDDVLAPARAMLALYRPALSYRPDQAIRLFPKARYFMVSIYRIRPGTEAEFGELVKLRRLSQDSVNLDRPDIAYQVASGAPSGTYIFLAPLATLRGMDDGVAPVPVYAEGIAAARAKEGPKISAEAEMSREHLLFRVEPRISYVSDDFAEGDAEFWRGRPKSQ
jgi:hypothetical protein